MRNDEYIAAAQGLLGGGVGSAEVQPHYPGGVGGPALQAHYPGGVGGPAVMQPSLGGQQYAYTAEAYRNGEVSYLGFGSTVIPAGAATVDVEISTKRPFTPQQLRVPSTVLGLLLLEVNIEGTNLFANSSGVPVELFSEVSTTPPIDWFTISPASGANLILKNIGSADAIFTGAFWGAALRK